MKDKEYMDHWINIQKQIDNNWVLYQNKRLNDITDHPINYSDLECAFVSRYMDIPRGSHILNVGSYNQFIIGLLNSYYVTTLDIRNRKRFMGKETIITEDINNNSLDDGFFDMIICLSSVEHFGLGRYGDKVDMDADKKAFEQFRRLLKPDGILFFTTTIKKGKPNLCFNAHKIYNQEIIDGFSIGFEKLLERYIRKDLLKFCSFKDIRNKPQTWDVYCGYWKKVI